EADAVALLHLVHQPGQPERVDALGDRGRVAVAVAGEHRDDLGPVGQVWLAVRHGHSPAGARSSRWATVAQNSPTVMPASSSDSSSVNFTPKRSSTRTASSASPNDSRSAPAGPSVVSSPMPSMS